MNDQICSSFTTQEEHYVRDNTGTDNNFSRRSIMKGFLVHDSNGRASGVDLSDMPDHRGSSNNNNNNNTLLNQQNRSPASNGKDDDGMRSSSGMTTAETATTTTTASGAYEISNVLMTKYEKNLASSVCEPASDRRSFAQNESSPSAKYSQIMVPSSMGPVGAVEPLPLSRQNAAEGYVIDTVTMNNTNNNNNNINDNNNSNNNKNSRTSRRSSHGCNDSDGSITGRWYDDMMAHHVVPNVNGNEEDKDEDQERSTIIWKIRLFCGKIVENAHFQLAIIILIVVNAIFMGIGTFDFVTDNPNVDKGFDSLDKAFLIAFTIELVLQLVYRSYRYFSDSWLVFDFVIVVVSWSVESLQIVRALRAFRAFRLVTRIGPLRELVMAIGAVMPRMYAIAMLLLLIFYIFAVLFTELFREVELETNYFGSLDRSLFTCMELMTLEWASIARGLMEQISWAWAPIMAFLSVTGFIVFNLIVAVVCDAVAVVDREVQAERNGDMETDTSKLEKTQERIWDMTEHVEKILQAQNQLDDLLLKLNAEMESLTGERTGIVRLQRPQLRRLSAVPH